MGSAIYVKDNIKGVRHVDYVATVYLWFVAESCFRYADFIGTRNQVYQHCLKSLNPLAAHEAVSKMTSRNVACEGRGPKTLMLCSNVDYAISFEGRRKHTKVPQRVRSMRDWVQSMTDVVEAPAKPKQFDREREVKKLEAEFNEFMKKRGR